MLIITYACFSCEFCDLHGLPSKLRKQAKMRGASGVPSGNATYISRTYEPAERDAAPLPDVPSDET
jgi:hypothetical protein